MAQAEGGAKPLSHPSCPRHRILYNSGGQSCSDCYLLSLGRRACFTPQLESLFLICLSMATCLLCLRSNPDFHSWLHDLTLLSHMEMTMFQWTNFLDNRGLKFYHHTFFSVVVGMLPWCLSPYDVLKKVKTVFYFAFSIIQINNLKFPLSHQQKNHYLHSKSILNFISMNISTV